jgi:hypothetical protein
MGLRKTIKSNKSSIKPTTKKRRGGGEEENDIPLTITKSEQRNILLEFFEYFENKNLSVAEKKVGEKSLNGEVFIRKYQKGNRDCYTIKKVAKKELMKKQRYEEEEEEEEEEEDDGPPKYFYGDNLMYEYFAGCYINTLHCKYPCLTDTYGLFDRKTNNLILQDIGNRNINHFVKDKSASKKSPRNSPNTIYKLKPDETYTEWSCKHYDAFYILIEYFPSPIPLNKWLLNNPFKDNYNEIIFTLFHLYFFLDQNPDFRHNDLHLGNILMCKPLALTKKYKKEVVRYIYHFDTGTEKESTLSFYSEYMPKLIDYGRCRFPSKKHNKKGKNSIEKKHDDEKPSELVMKNDPKLTDCGYDNIHANMTRRTDKKDFSLDIWPAMILYDEYGLKLNEKLTNYFSPICDAKNTLLNEGGKEIPRDFQYFSETTEVLTIKDVFHNVLELIKEIKQEESKTTVHFEIHVFDNGQDMNIIYNLDTAITI